MLVSKHAPDFVGKTVGPDGNFAEISLQSLRGKKVLLFFYPVDFSFVCPTELIAVDRRMQAFRDRDVAVVGISTDSQYCHWAWREMAVDQGGIGRVQFPLVADMDKSISRAYDVLMNCDADGAGGDMALRATFLIDEAGIVQHATINNLPLGRNLDETLRTVDTLIHHQQHGEVCPAGWQPGQVGMQPNQAHVRDYLEQHGEQL